MKYFVCIPYNACASEHEHDEMTIHQSLSRAQEWSKQYIRNYIEEVDKYGEWSGSKDIEWRPYLVDDAPLRGDMLCGYCCVVIYDVKFFE